MLPACREKLNVRQDAERWMQDDACAPPEAFRIGNVSVGKAADYQTCERSRRRLKVSINCFNLKFLMMTQFRMSNGGGVAHQDPLPQASSATVPAAPDTRAPALRPVGHQRPQFSPSTLQAQQLH
jgi:hypothetical protein